MLALKKIAFMGAIFFHWLLIIFKYGHFGISFMVVVPSVAAQQPFCRQNFQILLLALQRILSSARKSQIFKSIWSCISRDYFKFGCGYLISIVGCTIATVQNATFVYYYLHLSNTGLETLLFTLLSKPTVLSDFSENLHRAQTVTSCPSPKISEKSAE